MIFAGKAVLETTTRAHFPLFYFEDRPFGAMRSEAEHFVRSCYPEALGVWYTDCGTDEYTAVVKETVKTRHGEREIERKITKRMHIIQATFNIDLKRLEAEQERRHPKFRQKGIPLYSQYISKE